MTDEWKISVDRQLQQLHGDVRNLLFGFAGGFLVLAGMIGGLYVHVDAKFDRANERVDRVNERAAATQVQVERINAKLDLLLERRGGLPR